LALLMLAPLAHAGDVFTRVEPAPVRELWIDSGFADRPLRSRQGPQRPQYRAGRSNTAGAPTWR
jgi:hypothetical protein